MTTEIVWEGKSGVLKRFAGNTIRKGGMESSGAELSGTDCICH
jgi:hypothetical protein